MDSADEAIASKNLDGIVTSWNPAAETLFGYTAAEIVGRHISVLAAPGREDEMPAILERIRRGEKVDRYETVRRRKDGSLVQIALTVSPIRDESGRIIGASKIARDITEQKRLHAALGASEERFRNLANAVPDIVWTAAPDGSITFANDRWFRFCGIAPEQNERDWPELVLHPDDRERCIEEWTRAIREGTDYEIEVRNRRHDGEYRWFLTRASPIRDPEGRITAWFGSTTDIHDRKQTEERQQILTAELSHRVENLLTVIGVPGRAHRRQGCFGRAVPRRVPRTHQGAQWCSERAHRAPTGRAPASPRSCMPRSSRTLWTPAALTSTSRICRSDRSSRYAYPGFARAGYQRVQAWRPVRRHRSRAAQGSDRAGRNRAKSSCWSGRRRADRPCSRRPQQASAPPCSAKCSSISITGRPS